MSRSLRHPFKGSHHYLRPEKDRGPATQEAQTAQDAPEPVLGGGDAGRPRHQLPPGPDSACGSPGSSWLALFALLGLRLWALTVLQAPAAAQAVTANQIRAVPVEPTRGLILDRYGNPLVNNQVGRADHPVPGGRPASTPRWSAGWPP